MEEKIVQIINKMADYLNVSQMKKLQEVLLQTFSENNISKEEISNDEYLQLFLDAKKIEGCSARTIEYYSSTVERMLQNIKQPIRKISTEEIRKYLVDYQKINNCSKVTVDNIRRNISSFFSWLEEEDYILKSPMRRIHKIKTMQPVKEIISDEAIELLRDNCKCTRDLAMIDLLYSTGIRVGDADGKISLNQQKPSKHAGLRRFGPEKFLQRNNEFMKERPIFYKKPIKTEKDFSTWLRCFYYTTKAVITEYIYF